MDPPPPPEPRHRIVTTHDPQGVAVVKSVEDIALKPAAGWSGTMLTAPVWTSCSVPSADNNDETDGALRTPDGDMGIVQRGGTYCGVTVLGPGETTSWHRTSSLDHNILISGTLILLTPDGAEHTLLTPGDVVIQRGTMHAWRNPGPGWAHWVAVLVDAEPARMVDGEEVLRAETRDSDERPV